MKSSDDEQNEQKNTRKAEKTQIHNRQILILPAGEMEQEDAASAPIVFQQTAPQNSRQEFFSSQTDFLSLAERGDFLTKQIQGQENNQALTDMQETLLQMGETLSAIQETLDKMDKDFWT